MYEKSPMNISQMVKNNVVNTQEGMSQFNEDQDFEGLRCITNMDQQVKGHIDFQKIPLTYDHD